MNRVALQDRLTTLVLANPDVLTVYSVRPAVLEVASRARSAVIDGQGRSPKVLVVDTNGGTTAEVSVGVTGERSASAVCRELHDSIAAELTTVNATPPLAIVVKISSIN